MLGGRFGKYRILSELGSGGMARVYLGEAEPGSPGLPAGGRVAVKVVHSHLITKESIFQRFLREFDVGRQIRHPNVVRTLDAGFQDVNGRPEHYIVMEYVEGQNLRSLLEELGWLPEDLCLHIAVEVAGALAAIHDAGIIHRDLKPENVIITADDVVKVMDLGVALVRDETYRLSETGQFVGSLLYSAPEQFQKRGSQLDGRTDLYQLGLLLFELATGSHPFSEDGLPAMIDRATAEGDARPSEQNPRLSPFFDELVVQLLQRAPRDRFDSAADLLLVLHAGEDSAWWSERSGAIRRRTRRPLRRMRVPRETALYGRESELKALGGLWKEVGSSQGQVAIIDGEPGIGKSRLLDEFVGILEGEGHEFHFLFGGYPPGGAATASGAFSTAYREHFGTGNLETSLAEYMKVTPSLVPAFAALLKGEPPPAGVEPLNRESIQTVFVNLTRALAAERPTVVLIDDLHYAPEEGRALFAALAHAVSSNPVLLVGTTHPGLSPRWVTALERLPHISCMPIGRLGKKHVQQILEENLGSPRVARELCPAIAARSGGNPFFIFEILRGLQQENRLVRKPDGVYSRVGSVADVQVPSTVKDLVQARISGLAEVDRDLLDMAACAGFEFDPLLLARALGEGKIPLLKKLGRLERQYRLVHSVGRLFVFDHQQVREALYDGLSDLLREEYHAALADALERLTDAPEKAPPDLGGRVCHDLCDHFLRGGRGAKALRYLDHALEHLENGHLHESVLELTERALRVEGLLLGILRAEVLLKTARALELMSRPDDELQVLLEARDLAREHGSDSLRAEVALRLGNCAYSRGEMAEALEQYGEARDLAVSGDDREKEGAAVGRMGTVYDDQGRVEEAREAYGRHLEIAREIEDRLGQAKALGNLALLAWEQGRAEEALEYLDRSLPIFLEVGNLRGEGGVANSRGLVLLHLGRTDEARDRFERQYEIARQIGYRRGESVALGNLGMVHHNVGHYAEAVETYDAVLDIWREIGNPLHEAITLLNTVSLALDLGERERARAALGEVADLVAKIGFRGGEVCILTDRGRLAMEEGDHDAAAECFRAAAELEESLGNKAGVAAALKGLGRMMYWIDRPEEALPVMSESLAILLETGRDAQIVLCLGYLVLLGEDRGAEFREALCSYGDLLGCAHRMEAHFLEHLATGERAALEQAHRRLGYLWEHSPPGSREKLLMDVDLNRRICAASAEAGLPSISSTM